MKMCYSQRSPFLQLQAASSSWSVWITSPLPGRVMEMWTFEQAELIYLHLLCFSPVPAYPQNICFVFYSSFNWEQCWMLSNWLFLMFRSQAPTLFFTSNWTTTAGTLQVFWECPHNPFPLHFLLEQWDRKKKMHLTFLNCKAMVICDYISPSAEWANHIFKISLETSN